MFQRAGADHNDNASNHGYNGSTATYYWRADDDNNDAHRRLLIAKAGRGWVRCRHGLYGRLGISKSSHRIRAAHRPLATVVPRSGFLSRRFCALGFLFLRLTHYGCDCLKLFAIAEIH